jgi:hypothetical protein
MGNILDLECYYKGRNFFDIKKAGENAGFYTLKDIHLLADVSFCHFYSRSDYITAVS